MPIATDIGSLIVRTKGVRGGRPCLAGTGFPVHRVIGFYKMGCSPEEIAIKYEHLDLARVHAAITYYWANRAEIDSYLEEEEDVYRHLAEKVHLTRRGVQ